MSSGNQLRDYLHVNEVSRRLCSLIKNPQISGTVNICSGTPKSVRAFVEEFLKKKKTQIELELGYYSTPEYEPIAFWGKSKYFDFNGDIL